MEIAVSATVLLQIIDQVPTPLIIVLDGRIESANRHACKIMNMTQAEITGSIFADLIDNPSEEVSEFLRSSSRTTDTHIGVLNFRTNGTVREFRCEGSLLTPARTGESAHLLVHLTPQDKAIKGFVVLNEKIEELNKEISLRRLTEQSLVRHVQLVSFGREIGLTLAQSRDFGVALDRCAELFRKQMDANAVGIWVRKLKTSKLVLKGFAAASDYEIKGRSIFDCFRTVLDRVDATQKSVAAAKISDVIKASRQVDGEQLSASGSFIAKPLIVDATTVGVLVLLSDREFPADAMESIDSVTTEIALAIERKRVDLELAKQTEALRIADQRKDEFLAMLAHELRNPLAPIRSGLDLLKIELPENDSIDIMQHQTEHLVRLVDDLLDVSRVMRGRIQLQKQPLKLRQLLSHAVETVRPFLESRNHEFIADLPGTEIWIHADEVRITQVFINLLHNAAKYTADHGRIEISTSTAEREVSVSIKDNGIGVEQKYISEMFELFSQSSRTIDRSAGGLGVGLTVVQKLINLHHGRIFVRSEGLNQGSEFTVILPTIDVPADLGDVQPERKGKSPCEGPKRVLVVDDMRGAAIMLKRLVSTYWNYEVEIAYDGEAACAAAKSYQPDVILLDIGLPGMNGYEVAQTLRQQADFEDTKIVAISGYGTEQDRQNSEKAGIDLHFAKPISVEQLVQVFGESEKIG